MTGWHVPSEARAQGTGRAAAMVTIDRSLRCRWILTAIRACHSDGQEWPWRWLTDDAPDQPAPPSHRTRHFWLSAPGLTSQFTGSDSVPQDLLATGQPGDGVTDAVGRGQLRAPTEQVLGTV